MTNREIQYKIIEVITALQQNNPALAEDRLRELLLKVNLGDENIEPMQYPKSDVFYFILGLVLFPLVIGLFMVIFG